MMTKEEYKKTLIRMWDSVREDDYKGKNDCSGVECNECPITSMCVDYMENINNAYNIIEFVEKWAKEHPIETNGSRFLKNYPKANLCGYEDGGDILHIRLDSSKHANVDNNMIKIPMKWWESEVDDADCD